ncbi:putative polyketide synthase [Burkholderia pseudomallei]|nr:putative polyketide synthase [Burkholderia pseudomallei]
MRSAPSATIGLIQPRFRIRIASAGPNVRRAASYAISRCATPGSTRRPSTRWSARKASSPSRSSRNRPSAASRRNGWRDSARPSDVGPCGCVGMRGGAGSPGAPGAGAGSAIQ